MITEKIIALTIQTFVGKVMYMIYNMLSRFVKGFLPISFNFMAAVTVLSDFGAKESKICHCLHFSSICHEMMGPVAHHYDLSFLNVEF